MNEMLANWRFRGRIKGQRGGIFHGFYDGVPVFGGGINKIFAPMLWRRTHQEALEVLETIKAKCEHLDVELELERCC